MTATEEHRFSRWAAGTVGLALLAIPLVCWAVGAPNPLAAPGTSSGRTLAFLPQPAAHLVMIACGALIIAAAVVRGERIGTAVRIAALGAFALLLDSGALAAIGYLPFMVVSAVTGHVDKLAAYLSVPLLMQLAMAVAAASLLWTVVARQAPGGAVAHELARARTARWTKIAMIAPLVYAATRFLMVLDVPGFAVPMDAVDKGAGLGLAVAATGGAVLTWGLIRPWGERWPRWMPRVAGREVPVNFPVVAALSVSVLVMTAAKEILSIAAVPGSALSAAPMAWLPMLLWPLWSVALALAALNYRARRTTTPQPAAV
ncbi:hypothetical protein SAMN05421805_10219 [Saccharopolyspora antimicrobica]|uniref:Uncharacterized protein n=1 Tax=Saccharopolyspora antimicrobica TaxID=455193 RepID=A0A1I4V5G0_9PSEU|nr:hypothetical protein [Saccharopolyspora antimicrobica]RKT86126.1 hypothetical protein ATL45_4486 [Saccharopolyspora antimicrobica]SFM96210.1 hypothetical protein SAMN05421805_10219 [Saccharopolyspora antimicrobica]